MIEKQVEQREKALLRAGGKCFICGKPLSAGQMQYAHKIGNTEVNRKKYGSFFIDSTMNGEICCSLNCNASLDIGKSVGNQLKVLADILIYETANIIGKSGLDYITDVLLDKYEKMGYYEKR